MGLSVPIMLLVKTVALSGTEQVKAQHCQECRADVLLLLFLLLNAHITATTK